MKSLSNQKIEISQDILSQEINGETVLLNLNNENYYGLDEVGTRIWQLINDQNDMGTIYHTLMEEYDVTPKKLEQDIDNFINDLVDGELISLV